MAKGGEDEMAQAIARTSSGNTSDWKITYGTAISDRYTTWYSEPPKEGMVVQHNIKYQLEEVREMRGLFHIYVVDYEHDQVVAEGHIIADDEAKAKMKALHQWNDAVANYDLDDLDIICVKLGSVRKKKEIQEVKILKE